jgi:hypothetical protein
VRHAIQSLVPWVSAELHVTRHSSTSFQHPSLANFPEIARKANIFKVISETTHCVQKLQIPEADLHEYQEKSQLAVDIAIIDS